ncbi:MAG: FHA domain-containing protein [Actinomycetes bacterium]
MSELTLTVIRLGFLAVLWAFVLTVAAVMRTDLFGQRVSQRSPASRTKAARPPKQPKQKRGVARTLVIVEGSLAGTELTLSDQPITIGRAGDCTLVLDDDYASNRHARFAPRDGTWMIEDMGSTNGTFLDRTRVTGPTVVPLGAPVRVGKTVIELRK